jgi:aminoglycoside phosphotransferase family enzyme/predicted kinase
VEFANLIEGLSRPAAYPHAVETVTVLQTHISVVFLAGPFAYKLKKPIRTGYLDFTTLDRRCHFCHEEVRLNRRLAPTVYLDVVTVTVEDGRPRVEGSETPLDWLVKMHRLPPEHTLRAHLERDDLPQEALAALAGRIAAFHASSPLVGPDSPAGRFERVAANIRATLPTGPDDTLPAGLRERLASAVEANLPRMRPIIEARAVRGLPRDIHGDIRLDHIYLFPERKEPDDIVVIDCIEFNEQFRQADPIAELAFPIMELHEIGRLDLADAFADAYFQSAHDWIGADGRVLVPFYSGYRAAVRAEVESMRSRDPGVAPADRVVSERRARALWLLALRYLDPPARRPCLILTVGLPGSGKSTLALALAAQADLQVFRADVVRKTLAAHEQDIYTPEWNSRTYAECRRLAAEQLAAGGRVLVDANFRAESQRRDFLTLAREWGVGVVILLCATSPETARKRLMKRVGDASDADWAVYQQAARTWEEFTPATERCVRTIEGDGTPPQMQAQALDALRAAGLL